ncbi:MAG: hypothetical protein HYU66_20215 [Armatimonadetes bacterium]|nr:hypothetical protein [Armatimonadota bacterium]
MTPDPAPAALELLARWTRAAERWWYPIAGRPDLGCYGTGYNSWGVQTNQKYLAALAAVAAFATDDEIRDLGRARALAALRFSLHSHVSGGGACTDGTLWGHTWISGLGLERMMYGVHLLQPHLTDADRQALRRVLTSEAEALLHTVKRGEHGGVVADRWNASGRNVPESNLWNGALLWRSAILYPDHPAAGSWLEQAQRLFMNGISVPADDTDERLVAGRPVREWHVGANYFPHYALDHHGYLNVGYMVICLSNVAILHFDLLRGGWTPPETLYHHAADLWQVVRRFVFADGRLARIGGDSRVRYAYCQEYLLPALLLAADRFSDPHALALAEAQVETIRREAEHHGDGSFYGSRLSSLEAENPYYLTRLESDRACALGMLAAWHDLVGGTTDGGFEASVAGGWCEPEHGAVMHRCPTRLASFAWRAYGLTQGVCQPPGDGDLAEWQQNLTGVVRFAGEGGGRKLVRCEVEPIEGGFVTHGAVQEGCGVTLAEGWKAEWSALHRIVFVALPDGHTVVGLEHVRAADHRVLVAEVKGLHLNLPNDLFNGFRRRLVTAAGEQWLARPAGRDEVRPLGGRWAHCDVGGLVGLYGAEELVVDRSVVRRGGRYRSLYAEELCWGHQAGVRAVDAGAVLLDVGWAVLSSATPEQTAAFAARAEAGLDGEVRWLRLVGLDGHRYELRSAEKGVRLLF